MQSPTRQAKVQAEQGATLPMAVKLTMVLLLVLGAAVTLRWSRDPPKFVLVRPFQVRARPREPVQELGHGSHTPNCCNFESAQLTGSNAHVTTRTCRGGCSMAVRQPLDSRHPLQAVAALRPRSLAAPGFSPAGGRFTMETAAAAPARNGSPQAQATPDPSDSPEPRTAGWPMCIDAVTQSTPPPLLAPAPCDCWHGSMWG
jgi:hypothetical protein